VKTLIPLLLLAALTAATGASAQILIGQTAGFTGAVAAGVKEISAGARLYLDAVNADGGIGGQKIELISMDDAFEPGKAAENAEELIVKRKVLALFLSRGTPHTQRIQPLLSRFGVPLIAPSTGAMVLHKPVHPWLFNVRATYQREAERAVAHLVTIGVQRIGVIHVDDSFGADLLEGAQRGLEAAKLKPASSRVSTAASPTSPRCWPPRARPRRSRCCSSAAAAWSPTVSPSCARPASRRRWSPSPTMRRPASSSRWASMPGA
jgi:branched-chain amino acid transport system substrate-binding protein